MADDRIEIEVVLDDGSIKKGFAKVQSEGKKSSRDLSRSFQGLTSTILGIGTALAGVFAGRRILAAAAQQEAAVQELNTSLRLAGSFSQEASESFQRFASELQNTTRFGDEAILQQLALARNFARSNEEAQKLVEVAVDLSEATGITLDSAVRNLGKTFAGLTGELGESVPIIRTLTAEQLKSGAALDLLAQRFGGAAAQNVQTFSGRIEQIGNLFGDFLEQLGLIVTRSPALTAVFGVIADAFSNVISGLREFRAGGDIFGDFIRQLLVFRNAVTTLFVAPIEIAFNTVKVAFNGIRLAFQTLIAGIAGGASRLVSFFAPDSELATNLKTFAQSSGEVFAELEEGTAQSVRNIFQTDVTEETQAFLDRLNDAVTNVKEGPFKNLEQAAAETSQKVNQNLFNIGSFLSGPLSTLIKNGVARIGASLVQGGAAFSGFGKFVLGILGDLLINVGFAVSGIGKAIEALRVSLVSITGGFAIAAGLALIALGGVLKGLAGGAGGLGVTGTAGTATGGGGVIAPGTTLAPEVEDEAVEAQQQTAVTVNVQGDVFDSRETGLRIADILNESFDTEGTVLATA